MTFVQVPMPKALEISPDNRGVNWDLFKQTWTNYETATGMESKPQRQRIAILLSVIGQDALIVYNAFHWSPGEAQTVEAILAKFEAYCKPKLNVSYERFVFMSRKQKKNESINDYTVALKNLVRNCDYGELTDSLVRDAIIMGVNSKKIQEALLHENDLTLDKCVNIVCSAEKAYEQFHVMATDAEKNFENMEIDKVSKETKKSKCKYCGLIHTWGKGHCPAYGKKCNNCNKYNHFRKMCKQAEKTDVNMLNTSGESEELKIE